MYRRFLKRKDRRLELKAAGFGAVTASAQFALDFVPKMKKPVFTGFIRAESVGFEPTCPVKDNCISSALLSMDFTGFYLILAGFDGN